MISPNRSGPLPSGGARGLDSSPGVGLRRLAGEASELQALQAVLEAAPGYAWRVTGRPVGAADADSTFRALPDGKSRDDKFVHGIFLGAAMVGCVDTIRDFPRPGVAHVGLFLIGEPWQRRGLGRAGYHALEAEIRAWRHCDTVRLGVVATNAPVIGFWRGLGFAATGEVAPFHCGDVRSQVIVYAKALRTTGA